MTLEELKELAKTSKEVIDDVVIEVYGEEIRYRDCTPNEILADLKKWTHFK